MRLFYFTQQNVTTVWQFQNLRAYKNPSQSGNLLQTGLVFNKRDTSIKKGIIQKHLLFFIV